MNASEFLGRVKIASPCRARWQDMTGDDRSRYCHQCRQHVYNFSAMSSVEVADLIRAKEGQLCGRFYRRRDGMMLTTDCPVGAEGHFQRLKALVAMAGALLTTSLGVRAWSSWEVPIRKGRFAEKCDQTLWTVKSWLELNRGSAVTMGKICITPPLSQPPLPQLTTSPNDPPTPEP